LEQAFWGNSITPALPKIIGGMERKVDIGDRKLGSMGLAQTSKVPQNKAQD